MGLMKKKRKDQFHFVIFMTKNWNRKNIKTKGQIQHEASDVVVYIYIRPCAGRAPEGGTGGIEGVVACDVLVLTVG